MSINFWIFWIFIFLPAESGQWLSNITLIGFCSLQQKSIMGYWPTFYWSSRPNSYQKVGDRGLNFDLFQLFWCAIVLNIFRQGINDNHYFWPDVKSLYMIKTEHNWSHLAYTYIMIDTSLTYQKIESKSVVNWTWANADGLNNNGRYLTLGRVCIAALTMVRCPNISIVVHVGCYFNYVSIFWKCN